MKIKTHRRIKWFAAVVVGLSFSAAAATPPFVGRLTATLTRGGQAQTFIYTAGTNTLRIECGEMDLPRARNLVDRETGAVTLLFPHDRSYVRLKSSGANTTARTQAMPGMPPPSAGMPPGAMPSRIGPQAGATPSAASAMPMMRPPGMEKLDLKAAGQKTNLLGYACARYEIKQRGEVMEIWATDQLLPYEPWRQNQPTRFGPPMLQEQWGELVKARKLFPLLATLKSENGPEQLRFEVKSVTPETIEDQDGALFRPPADYQEIEPLPF